MRPDDDDDEVEFGPPPDPSLRAWRHPSEIAAAEAAAARFAATDSSTPDHWRHPKRAGLRPSGGVTLATVMAVTLAALALVAGFGLDASTAGDLAATGGGDRPSPKGSARSLLTADLAATALAPTRPGGTGTTTVGTTLRVTTSSSPTASATSGPESDPLTSTTTALTARTATTLADGARILAVQQAVWADVGGTPTRLAAFALIDGMVVTSASAVDGHHHLTVSHGAFSAPATVIGADPVTDVAVLQVGDGDATRDGHLDQLLLNGDGTPTLGTAVTGSAVSEDQIARNGAGQRLYGLLLTSTMVPEGSTGAPLVDDHGRLMGLVIGTTSPLLYAVPAEQVIAVGRSLTETGSASTVWLGLDGETTTSGTARIRSVDPGGPAAQAGLLPGDVLTAVDGVAVLDWHHVVHLIRHAGPGAEVMIRVDRDGTIVPVPVVTGSRTTG